MLNKWRNVVLGLALLPGLLGLVNTCFAAETIEWQVGLAKTVITPDEPTWLSGYGGRRAPADGKIHDLWAKAVAFEDAAGTRLVLVTLDLGSVNVNMTNAVVAEVEKRYQLPRANVVFNCSHTHCAPEIAAEREVFHNLPPEAVAALDRYIAKTNDQLVELVGSALNDLKPARLSYSNSSAGFAFNRRGPNGVDPNGAMDREVPVLQITDDAGKLRGVLFGYACHNTTLAFQQYCGDYAGFAQYALEEKHPEAMALFVMGCGGDQNPQPRHGDMGLQHAQNHGKSLANAVEDALAGPQTPVHGPLRVAYGEALLDLEPLPEVEVLREQAKSAPGDTNGRKAAYLLSIIDRGKEVPLVQTCPLHVAKFGDDLLMIFISGETVVDYSLRCKADFAGPKVWVPGYCDDVFAYLPSRRVLIEGGYEGRTSIYHQLMATPFLTNVEDRVMTEIEKLVEQVSAK